MISKLQYITQGETAQDHLDHIQTACASGAEWVQLRLKGFDPKTILETAKKARELTAHYQTRLIINDYYKVAKEVNADGVHLGKKDDCPLKVRAYLGKFYSIGGTANTLEECKVLLDKKVDYIGLGPFRFTETKKNLSPVLGVDGYKKIIEELKTQTPIIAIGG
ncbi:thiamine phosphate synthase, partial [Tenacibaculum finnmarkense]